MDGHYRNKQVSGYSTCERRKTNKNSKNENALKKMLKKLPRKSLQITTFLSKNKGGGATRMSHGNNSKSDILNEKLVQEHMVA